MNKVLAVIEHTPFAIIGKIWLNTVGYLLAYIIIICLFYFLFDRKSWLLKLSLTAMLLLYISLSFKKVNTFQSDRVTFLNLKKHRGMVFKNSDQAVVLSDMKADDKNYQYSVQPCLDGLKIEKASLLNIGLDARTVWFAKRANLIEFKNKLILIFDNQLPNKLLPQKLKVDYMYATGNPHTNLNVIYKNYNY